MAHFLNGLNHPITRITSFQPYNNLLKLVHQATMAAFPSRNFTSNPQAITSVVPYPRATPPSGVPSSSNAPATTSSRPPANSYKPRATPSANPPRDSANKKVKMSASQAKAMATSPLSAPIEPTMVIHEDVAHANTSTKKMKTKCFLTVI